MAFSNKLHNPTPFKVNFNYHKGINLTIEPFSCVDLPMPFVEDFVKGQPGSEAVWNELAFYGIFLEDPNRSYESQAVDALKAAVQSRDVMVKEVTENIRKSMAALGTQFTQDALDEQLELSGVLKLKTQIVELKELISIYDNVVSNQKPVSAIKAYDLTRTVLALDPPKEFPTKEAMEFFLRKNPAVKAQNDAMIASMTPKKGPGRPSVKEETSE